MDLLRECHQLAATTAEWAGRHQCHALQAELSVVASSLAAARGKRLDADRLASVADALADVRDELRTLNDADARSMSPWLLLKILWKQLDAAGVERVEGRHDWPMERPTLEGKDVAATVASWWRQEALRHHPDRGGEPKVMAALLDAYERLKAVLGLA